MNYLAKTKKRTIRNIFFGMILVLSASLYAQGGSSARAGVLQFESEVIDFGTIAQNSDGERTFIFKNVGNSPIVITNIKASCGCTVPSKPEKAILPGETAKIGVKYDTKRVGSFSKTLTVTSNADQKIKTLKIKGKVVKGKTNVR